MQNEVIKELTYQLSLRTGRKRLDKKIVKQIYLLRSKGMTYRDIRDKLNISIGVISKVLNANKMQMDNEKEKFHQDISYDLLDFLE